MRPSRLLVLLVSSVAFTACLSGNETGPIAGPSIDCETLATGLAAADSTLTTLPSGLKYRDVTVGTGPVADSGWRVSVNYSGCLTSGLKFDEVSVKDPKNALKFSVGLVPPVVIPGFDEGVLGMRVGGRRQLVIPPALAYKDSANGPIPANSTLVFTVDLLATQQP